MNFERNRDPKQVLNVGIAQKLPIWMKDSGYSHEDYYDVWRWAMEEGKDFIFPYIVERRGKKWNTETIRIGMEDNNSLLWESVSTNCLAAVKAILEVPDLFSEEVLTMEYGTSRLKETYMRGDTKTHFRGTNFAQYLSLAMTQAKGDFRLQDALKNYYEDELRKRKKR